MSSIVRLAGGTAAAGLALTGLLALPGQAAPAAVPTVSASTVSEKSARTSLPECTATDLTASFRDTDAAMSHRYGTLILTNTGGRTCTTRGYGGLSYVGHGDGTQIGAAAVRDATGVKPRTLVLKPGAHARSTVSQAVAAVYPRHTCRPTHVDGLRVYVPDETQSLYVSHHTTGCANPRVHLLSHQAFR